MPVLDDATQLTSVADNRWRATIDPRFALPDGRTSNGGYLVSLACRAIGLAVPHPDVVTVTGHLLRPPDPEAVLVDVAVGRIGGTQSTATAVISDDRGDAVRVTATFGDLSSAPDEPVYQDASCPLPAIEQCDPLPVASDDGHFRPPPVFQQFEHRVVPGALRWATGDTSNKRPATYGEWIRFADQSSWDTTAMPLAADMHPPSIFNTEIRWGWVPTIELTVHVFRRPDPRGWLGTSFRTRFAPGPYLEEDGEIWSEDGALIATARQMALLPRQD